MTRLTDRKILITGAASGMGEATAELFVAEGATVFLVDINHERLSTVGKRLGMRHQALDVSDDAAVGIVIRQAGEQLGGIDGIVNAAGVVAAVPIDEMQSSQFLRLLQVNLLGPFHVIRASLPHLRKASAATIVNIASVSGFMPSPNYFAYCASKAGLLAMGKGLAQDLGPHIRVNTVCPGYIKTELMRKSWEDPVKYQASISANVLHRLGTAQEVANMCLFLSTNDSGFSTGSSFVLDGGLSWH